MAIHSLLGLLCGIRAAGPAEVQTLSLIVAISAETQELLVSPYMTSSFMFNVNVCIEKPVVFNDHDDSFDA